MIELKMKYAIQPQTEIVFVLSFERVCVAVVNDTKTQGLADVLVTCITRTRLKVRSHLLVCLVFIRSDFSLLIYIAQRRQRSTGHTCVYGFDIMSSRSRVEF